MSLAIDWKTLNADYSTSEVKRSEMDQFKMIQRGSVRMCMNRVRTEEEQRDFIQRGKTADLPRK